MSRTQKYVVKKKLDIVEKLAEDVGKLELSKVPTPEVIGVGRGGGNPAGRLQATTQSFAVGTIDLPQPRCVTPLQKTPECEADTKENKKEKRSYKKDPTFNESVYFYYDHTDLRGQRYTPGEDTPSIAWALPKVGDEFDGWLKSLPKTCDICLLDKTSSTSRGQCWFHYRCLGCGLFVGYFDNPPEHVLCDCNSSRPLVCHPDYVPDGEVFVVEPTSPQPEDFKPTDDFEEDTVRPVTPPVLGDFVDKDKVASSLAAVVDRPALTSLDRVKILEGAAITCCPLCLHKHNGPCAVKLKTGKNVCKHYKKGHCRKGNSCHFTHIGPVDAPSVPSKEVKTKVVLPSKSKEVLKSEPLVLTNPSIDLSGPKPSESKKVSAPNPTVSLDQPLFKITGPADLKPTKPPIKKNYNSDGVSSAEIHVSNPQPTIVVQQPAPRVVQAEPVIAEVKNPAAVPLADELEEIVHNFKNLNFRYKCPYGQSGALVNASSEGWIAWILRVVFGTELYTRVSSRFIREVKSDKSDARDGFSKTTLLSHKDPLFCVTKFREFDYLKIFGFNFLLNKRVNFDLLVSYRYFTDIIQGPLLSWTQNEQDSMLACARSFRSSVSINIDKFEYATVKPMTQVVAFKYAQALKVGIQDINFPLTQTNPDFTNSVIDSARSRRLQNQSRSNSLRLSAGAIAMMGIAGLAGLAWVFLRTPATPRQTGHHMRIRLPPYGTGWDVKSIIALTLSENLDNLSRPSYRSPFRR